MIDKKALWWVTRSEKELTELLNTLIFTDYSRDFIIGKCRELGYNIEMEPVDPRWQKATKYFLIKRQ